MDAFSCPGCALRLVVPDALAGTHIRCPECSADVPVPRPLDPAEAVRRGWPIAPKPAPDGARLAATVPTPVDIHDILPHDPSDDGRLQPWRVSRWIGMGGAIVFGSAAVLTLCLVQGYRQIVTPVRAAANPPALALPRPAVLVIPPPPMRHPPAPRPRSVPVPAPEPAPAPIIINAPGS